VTSTNIKQAPAAKKGLATNHARLCREIALAPGLFRSRFDGEGERPKLTINLPAAKGHSLTIKAFDALDAYDAKTLATVVALSGPNGITLTSSPRSEIGQICRALLDPKETTKADAIYVMTTPTALLREMGISRGKDQLKALTDSLGRLSGVNLHASRGDLESEAIHLMAYHSTAKEGRDWMCVTLNPVAAVAITGGQYVRLDMDELRAIKKDTTIILYMRLCAMIDWPTGKRTKTKDGLSNTKSFKLNTLLPYVWPDKSGNQSTARSRNLRLREALDELAGLPHWTATEYVKNTYRITRLHHPKGEAGNPSE
jgi:hypothetical protein